MNLGMNELGMFSLFSEASLVQAHGIGAIVGGLAPTGEYVGVLKRFEEGLGVAGVPQAGDFSRQAARLRVLLNGKTGPADIREAQRKTAKALEGMEASVGVRNVSARACGEGVEAPAAESLAMEVDIRAGRHLHNLGELVRISTRITDAQMVLTALMEQAGLENVRLLQGRKGDAALFGVHSRREPAPPAVLFVGAYDVGDPPAGLRAGADPSSCHVWNDRLFGHGVHTKAGIIAALAALEVFAGKPISATVGMYIDGNRQTGSATVLEHLEQISGFDPELIFILGPHYHETGDDFILFENVGFGLRCRRRYYEALERAFIIGHRREAISLQGYNGATALEKSLSVRFPRARIFPIPFADGGAEKFEGESLSIPLFVKRARFLAAFITSVGHLQGGPPL